LSNRYQYDAKPMQAADQAHPSGSMTTLENAVVNLPNLVPIISRQN
jgi:hypothetical protein